MHEAAITHGIIDTVLRAIDEQGITAPVTAVNITVGVGQGIVPESMKMFFDMDKADTPLADAELEIELLPMKARCPSCENERSLELPILLCPDCGGQMTLIQGMELKVTSIEVDQ